MRCQFDSFPPPVIQWVKMVRTPQDPDGGHVLVQDNDPQVIDIHTRQIGPTLYETQLTVRTRSLFTAHVSAGFVSVQPNAARLRFELRMPRH